MMAPQVPQLAASPSLLPETDLETDPMGSQDNLSRLVAEEVAKRLAQASGNYAGQFSSPTGGPVAGGGIAPEATARYSVPASPAPSPTHGPSLQDRGIYHAAEAMREMYDMGDAPSCGTCGAIMVRNGSCYRCMSCGSTSGCS